MGHPDAILALIFTIVAFIVVAVIPTKEENE